QPTFAGLDQAFNQVFSQQLLDPNNSSSFNDDFRARSYAGYLNTDFDVIPERLTISGGLRYTIDRKDEHTRTFPRDRNGGFSAVATDPPMPNPVNGMTTAADMAAMANQAGMTGMANMMMEKAKAAPVKSQDRVSGESPSSTFNELTPSADLSFKLSD